MKISNTEAIISLNPNAEFKCNNHDIDTIKWLNGTEEISKSTILAEVKRLQADYDSKSYARGRQQNFPNEHDLLIALWEKVMEDRSESADALQAIRTQVKSDNPKP